MNQPAITVIINNNTYHLSTSNAEAIRRIPNADRQQLLALLEVVKQQQSAAPSAISPATTETATVYDAGTPVNHQTRKSERLSSSDVDTLMAQLIMEERSKQKPGLTRETIYKWVAGIAVVIILLVVLF